MCVTGELHTLGLQRRAWLAASVGCRRWAAALRIGRRMDIGALVSDLPSHYARLGQARQAIGDEIRWYPYDVLENIPAIDELLHGEHRDLSLLAGGLPVADIGGADGDLAFVLEQAGGFAVDFIDTAGPNMNEMAGVRALREYLGSRVGIYDIDLDSQFRLPAERYGLVFLLGILYHLQNPFFVLRELSRHARYCVVGTRVARFAGTERAPIAHLPIAYLVGPEETNNDASNYWMFSPAGLDRITERAGWATLARASFGDVDGSDPSSPEHDERGFVLLQSNVTAPRVLSREADHRGLRVPRLRLRWRS
jgi:tRNA (mo5U34)-methyltransferase